MIACFFAVVLFVFFSPRMRHDGILYVNPARSLLIDGDLNTYNESLYYSQPGWNSVLHRRITGRQPVFVKYVNAPEYTDRGYRHVVFPIGNALTWLPALSVCHGVVKLLHGLQPTPVADGYSWPYLFSLGWWSFLIGFGAFLVAYRFLRYWYPPAVACFAVIFVAGAGNIIPFMSIDVTFSHVIDLAVVNGVCLVCAVIIKRSRDPDLQTRVTWPVHALAGFACGWAVITRYQDITLLLIPVGIYSIDMFYRKRLHVPPVSQGIDRIAFFSAFLLTTSLQWIYWKILYGRMLVSGTLLGTGGLPSFHPTDPDLLPMLFSRFHGLFSWMPWLIPLTLAAFLFLRREPRLGGLFLLVFLSQCYYNSSRSEWWNLGFSVRRFSGWSIVFMVGAAELTVLIRKSWQWISVGVPAMAIILWQWVFIIHYSLGHRAESFMPDLLRGLGPYGPVDYGFILPSLTLLMRAGIGVSTWFLTESWTGFTRSHLQSGHSGIAASILIGQVVMAGLLILIARRGLCIRTLPLRRICWGILGLILTAAAGMGLSDALTEQIDTAIFQRGRFTGDTRRIRIHHGSPFLGENEFITLSDREQSFEITAGSGSRRCDWLIGIPGDVTGNRPVDLEWTINGIRREMVTLSPADRNSGVIAYPWGNTEYSHSWYWGTLELNNAVSESSIVSVRVVDGPEILLAALYTRSF